MPKCGIGVARSGYGAGSLCRDAGLAWLGRDVEQAVYAEMRDWRG